VAGNGVQRSAEFGCHVFDEASFAATRRAFEQYRQLAAEGVFKQRYFLRLGLVMWDVYRHYSFTVILNGLRSSS
jgi:hypothetical protein